MTRLGPSPAPLLPPACGQGNVQPAPGRGDVSPDEAARVRLGASTETAPELLAALATDPAPTVRAAVALNTAAPAVADRILAGDQDERIRTLLARKLANLLPNLHSVERDRLQHHVLLMLASLIEDEAERVRAAIADVVKEMPQAPRELILRLAHDTAVPVSEPVIRLSPLLTTEDLLALLAAAPNRAAPTAVARRAGLNETLCDAVAATSDTVAIAALLANRSAAIREATLDTLVAGAADITSWHAPLVRRPRLSPRAARTLSDYVASWLLEELTSRADLTPDLAAELKRRLEVRLRQNAPATPLPAPNMDEAMAEALALAGQEQLHEATLLDAVQRGEACMAIALLAAAAGVPVSVVERAATLRSAKALVSLIWRAGFSMQVAGPVQTLLSHTPPAAVLRGGPGGTFPLAVDEMRWQIDFLLRMGR